MLLGVGVGVAAPAGAAVSVGLAVLPAVLRQQHVRDQFWRMIARPERIDPAVAEIAADEFLRTHRSRAARVAFYAAARQIYLETPDGPDGFWTRLEGLRVPALFVWGREDRVVPASFSPHVGAALPGAAQVVLEECGHVPQIELPERTHGLIRDFVDSAGEMGGGPALGPLGVAA